MLREQTYFIDGLSSIEEVREAYGPILDGSTLQKIADCPRKFQIRQVEGLRKANNVSAPMAAGSAVHLGLDYYYSVPSPDEATEREAIEVMAAKWRDFDIDRALVDSKYSHLSENHLRQVMSNYFDTWNRQRIEVYKPIGDITLDDLDLSQVIAAKWRFNDNDDLILGESSLIMEFDVEGESLVLAGKPDLPVVKQDGSVYVMDHKMTNSYLSDWWSQTHEVSNKLRGYMAMLRSLMPGIDELSGAIINGIYVGQYATNPNSKATKFQRFQFDFTPDHVDEALKNQLYWNKTINFYLSEGYFPQGCAFGGCAHPDICRRDPDTREEVKRTDYAPSDHTFWDL